MRLVDKVATIVPIPYLTITTPDRYFMALTHLLSHSHYFEFYFERAQTEAFVILDNSTVELGAPEDIYVYLRKAIALGADQILLPDWLQNRIRTLNEVEKGLREIAKTNYSGEVMVVPQGESADEWLACLDSMLKYPIHAIGISKRYYHMFGGSRVLATLAARYVCEQVGRPEVKIHLLGCEQYPERDVAPVLGLDYVQGVDSSLPAVFAAADTRLTSGAMRPTSRMIHMGSVDIERNLLQDNYDAWRSLCATSPFAVDQRLQR